MKNARACQRTGVELKSACQFYEELAAGLSLLKFFGPQEVRKTLFKNPPSLIERPSHGIGHTCRMVKRAVKLQAGDCTNCAGKILFYN